MNARLLWTFALACALNVGALHAATDPKQPMKVLTDRLEQSLREFDNAPADHQLGSLADEVYAFRSPQEPSSRVRSFKARSLVQILAAIEAKIDPAFDSNKPPFRNISPPAQAYPAGVAPSSIQDESQRREYEAAIAANKAKADVFEQQAALTRERDRVASLLETLAADRTANPSESLLEFSKLLDQYKVSSSSRARILKAVPRVG